MFFSKDKLVICNKLNNITYFHLLLFLIHSLLCKDLIFDLSELERGIIVCSDILNLAISSVKTPIHIIFGTVNLNECCAEFYTILNM